MDIPTTYTQNNKKSFNDCEICCENTWAPQCGAFNNCDKRVCDDCFTRNWDGAHGYIKKCMFCFEEDIKRSLVHHMSEYRNNIDFDGGYSPLGKYMERVIFWVYRNCEECEEI